MQTINILELINNYDIFLKNVEKLINQKKYIEAKQLLTDNLALHKEEIYKIVKPHTINIVDVLDKKADKLIYKLIKNK